MTLKRSLQLLLLASTCWTSIPVGAQVVVAEGHNVRQVPEGFWAGGRPTTESIVFLAESGVRLVISSVTLNQRLLDTMAVHGIERQYLRIGSTFPDHDQLLAFTEGYQNDEIFVHCTHGGDRAGALLAFFLVMRTGWSPEQAILAAADPNSYNLTQVIAVLEEFDVDVTRAERQEFGGIYSGAANGGTGGLKAHDEPYRNLIRTTLRAFQELGVPLEATSPSELPPSAPAATSAPSDDTQSADPGVDATGVMLGQGADDASAPE